MQQPLEQAVAETILQRFESFYSRFLEITQGSKSRFENSDWLGVQLAGRERIRLYDHHVGATTALIKQMMGATLPSQALLKQVKGRSAICCPSARTSRWRSPSSTPSIAASSAIATFATRTSTSIRFAAGENTPT